MGDWPSSRMGFANRTYGSARIALQSGNNEKSAWTEIIASTPFAGYLMIDVTPADITDFLVDIGIGAEGSEIVLMGDILVSCISSNHYAVDRQLTIPILIPAGTRISFRAASNGGNDFVDCSTVVIGSGGFMNPSGFALEVTYGESAADSGGTSIDPGGVVSTKGAWVQIIASAGFSFKGLAIGIGNQRNAAMASALWYMDVGLTAAPANAIIVSDYKLRSRSENDMIYPSISPIIPVDIPAGTEVHVRASCDSNDATDRLFDVVLYCFG